MEKIKEILQMFTSSKKNKFTLLGGVLIGVSLFIQTCTGDGDLFAPFNVDNINQSQLDELDSKGKLDQYKQVITKHEKEYINLDLDSLPIQTFTKRTVDEYGNEVEVKFRIKGLFIDAEVNAKLNYIDSIYFPIVSTEYEEVIVEVPIFKFLPPDIESKELKDSTITDAYRLYYTLGYSGQINSFSHQVYISKQRIKELKNSIFAGMEYPFGNVKEQNEGYSVFLQYQRKWKQYSILLGAEYQPNKPIAIGLDKFRVRAGVGYNF